MLVLSRKQNEKIVIGDNIIIEVVRIEDKRVILGISAPGNVKILRSELVADKPAIPVEEAAGQTA